MSIHMRSQSPAPAMKTIRQPDRGAPPRKTAGNRPTTRLAVAALGLLTIAGVCVGLSFNDQEEETVYSPTPNSSKLASTSSDRTFPVPTTPPPVAPSPASPQPVAPAAPTTPAGGATSASATADHPFVNALGMKFAPVEITGGPTDGKRVLFSVWDTRVQDYAEFAQANRFVPEQPPFAQDPTHPAVNISWRDAKVFCWWLTKTERAAGKIGNEQEYRLPSDHEWSCAVGIGRMERAEASPESKRGRLGQIYPWGTQWPPPKGAGNYDPKFQVDDFEYTSPVGSFAPNNYGLYDMGGNVWQWCEDSINSRSDHRVIRGGACLLDAEVSLRSSFRFDFAPTRRHPLFGFRCVLANAADTAKPASGKPTRPTAGPTCPPNGVPNQSTPAPTTPPPRGLPGTPAPSPISPRNTPRSHGGPGSLTPPWTL